MSTDPPVSDPAGVTLRPPRRAFVLAYVAVVVSGLVGAAIGLGLADVFCRGECALDLTVGAILGAAVAAGGVGVVAVLVLRAMHEWRAFNTAPPDDADAQGGGEGGGVQPEAPS